MPFQINKDFIFCGNYIHAGYKIRTQQAITNMSPPSQRNSRGVRAIMQTHLSKDTQDQFDGTKALIKKDACM